MQLYGEAFVAFWNVMSGSVLIPPAPPPAPPSAPSLPSATNAVNVPALIGGLVAAGVLLILAAAGWLLFLRRRTKRSPRHAASVPPSAASGKLQLPEVLVALDNSDDHSGPGGHALWTESCSSSPAATPRDSAGGRAQGRVLATPETCPAARQSLALDQDAPEPGARSGADIKGMGFERCDAFDAQRVSEAFRRMAHGSSVSLRAGSKASFRLGLEGEGGVAARVGSSFNVESFVVLGSTARLAARQSLPSPSSMARATRASSRFAVGALVSPWGAALAAAALGSAPEEPGGQPADPAAANVGTPMPSPEPVSPWGAGLAAAALGLSEPEASPTSGPALVSPWGAMLAAAALGPSEPEDIVAACDCPPPDPALVSPWGAVLAGAALGMPSVDLAGCLAAKRVVPEGGRAPSVPPSVPVPAPGIHHHSSSCIAASSDASFVRISSVPMISDLLLPFHPSYASMEQRRSTASSVPEDNEPSATYSRSSFPGEGGAAPSDTFTRGSLPGGGGGGPSSTFWRGSFPGSIAGASSFGMSSPSTGPAFSFPSSAAGSAGFHPATAEAGASAWRLGSAGPQDMYASETNVVLEAYRNVPLGDPSTKAAVAGSPSLSPAAAAAAQSNGSESSDQSQSFASGISSVSTLAPLNSRMTGRMATKEPNPNVHFELDWER